MQRKFSLLMVVFTVLVTFSFFLPQARAATETVVYSFKDPDDGVGPVAPVLPLHGRLYGTTVIGGTHDLGTVFELTHAKSGWMKTTLHDFTGLDDGENPWAGLVADKAGNLYGSAASGGRYGDGVIFELSRREKGWGFTVIHAFSGPDGGAPGAALIFDDSGNLYGTAGDGGKYQCGPYSTCGTVFELSPAKKGWKLTTLHDFDEKDGAGPASALYRDGNGNLYGTAEDGGGRGCNSTYGCGTVFELSPSKSGWKFEVIHRFDGTDGAFPIGALIMDKAGDLYGTGGQGGVGLGVAYRLAQGKSGWEETVLHAFTGSPDGEGPTGGVTFESSGSLYGTTDQGGSDGAGTIFELARSRKEWQESVAFSFDGSDGFVPEGGLARGDAGEFYGTASDGGDGYGLVFEFVP